MKVLINAINARQGGGRTYLFNLLSHIPDVGFELTLLVGKSFDETLISNRINVLKVSCWIENPLLRPWWERWILPSLLKRGAYDGLFCPGGVVNTVVPIECKLITMSRNMLPFDQKQRSRYPLISFQRLRNWMLARIMYRSMLAADLVIFVSEYAKKVIETHIGVKLRKSVVIAHGIAEQFCCDDTSLQYPEGMPEKYLLYVSNVDVYKTQLEVVRAFSLLQSDYSDLTLILVGPERDFYAKRVRREIDSLGLSERVMMLGSIPYLGLPAMYQHALVNVFASECENCPNILLEMMASGRPVVCSDYPPMPEFAGDSVIYFDPENPDELAVALRQAMNDESLQENLRRLAKKKVENYHWEDTSMRTWHEMKEIVKK